MAQVRSGVMLLETWGSRGGHCGEGFRGGIKKGYIQKTRGVILIELRHANFVNRGCISVSTRIKSDKLIRSLRPHFFLSLFSRLKTVRPHFLLFGCALENQLSGQYHRESRILFS